MTDKHQKKQNEQKDELRDLDVPAGEAQAVKGGYGFIAPENGPDLYIKAMPPKGFVYEEIE